MSAGSQRDGTLGCRSGTYHRRRATLSRAGWLGSTPADTSMRPTMNVGNLKQGVFPSMIVTDSLIQRCLERLSTITARWISPPTPRVTELIMSDGA